MTEQLLAELERQHGAELRGFARKRAVSPEDAEDAYQHALFGVWRRVDPLPDVRAARRYAYICIRNEVTEQHERRRRLPTAPLSKLVCEDPRQDPVVLAEQREQLARLAVIDRGQLRALWARGLGLGHAEIGDATGLSPRQIRKRIEKGRRAAQALVEGGARGVTTRPGE